MSGRVLFALGLVSVLSAVIRFGGGAVAIAADTPDLGAATQAETPAVLAALAEKEATLEEWSASLSKQELDLATARTELENRLAELDAAQEALSDTLALADDAVEDDLARLTLVYENMKPRDASIIFETMAPEFAAGFVARMQPEASAAIMAGLEPETAYSISLLLAARNSGVPTE